MVTFKLNNYATDETYLKLINELRDKKFSFSQSLEDLRLQRVLNYDNGIFVDIGSAHPIDDNVTFFLSRKGWSGICVDAFPQREDLYKTLRPEAKLVKTIINDGSSAIFYQIMHDDGEWTGLSTTSKEVADRHAVNGFVINEITMSGITLKDLLIKNNVKKDFDVLSLDLEGTAKQALSYGFFDHFRPKIICLEVTLPTLPIRDDELVNFVKHHNYDEIAFDGLNSFFVPREMADQYRILAAQPCPFVDGMYFQWLGFGKGSLINGGDTL